MGDAIRWRAINAKQFLIVASAMRIIVLTVEKWKNARAAGYTIVRIAILSSWWTTTIFQCVMNAKKFELKRAWISWRRSFQFDLFWENTTTRNLVRPDPAAATLPAT